MSTLLLRLAAPLQSWGSSSRFKKLTTEREPTKSGIVGLLAAALGRERESNFEDLASLRFGVRVDQPGELLQDFHTAHSLDGKQAFISYRHYLCDAIFVVGLESDDEALLDRIEEALSRPRFPLYLGRRACPPTGQIVLERKPLPLEEALQQLPWQAALWYQRRRRKEQEPRLELVIDAQFNTPGSFTRRDLPLSFDPEHRRYGFRSLRSDIEAIPVENPQWKGSDDPSAVGRTTEQDPFIALEVD
jgi:CRISPR system Cascade subunit CasD